MFCYDALHCVTLSVWKCIASPTGIMHLYVFHKKHDWDTLWKSPMLRHLWIGTQAKSNSSAISLFQCSETIQESLSKDRCDRCVNSYPAYMDRYIGGHKLSRYLLYMTWHSRQLCKKCFIMILLLWYVKDNRWRSYLQRMALMDVAMAMIPSLLLPVSFVWDSVSFWSENWHFEKCLRHETTWKKP